MDAFLKPEFIHPFILSFKITSFCFLLFVVIGLPMAYGMSKDFKLKWLCEAVLSLPLIFPPIATGFCLLVLLGDNGVLGKLLAKYSIHFIFSFKGLCLAGFVSGLPLLIKPVQAAILNFPQNIKEASFIAGKSELTTFFRIILPCLKTSILASLVLALARVLGEVGISLMLGGNIIGKSDTLSLAIYNAVFDGEYDLAFKLCTVLICISLAFFTLLYILDKKRERLF